ncbi:uncharacterized protein [Nicotiana sylvestris]|uniref:uncharacterized protein n=1 Tax=Nicotiana sylvestris TaxID=4096 RepID=UPI00388C9A02
MTIKLVVGDGTLNVVSTYAPQEGLDEDIKRRFWEGLDEIVCSILPSERLFIGGDFNGHIGLSAGGYMEVHGGFGFGEQNGGGISLLDFAKDFDLVIANSSFAKWDKHLVTYQSSVAKTQIDYLLLRRCDRRLCKDCKVIPVCVCEIQVLKRILDVRNWAPKIWGKIKMVNYAMHGANSTKVRSHVLVPRVVVDTVFIYREQVWQRISGVGIGF